MKLKKIISVALSCCLLLSSGISGSIIHEQTVAAAPKSRVSVHDPSIFKDTDGTYYVFGSHIDAAKSKDLQNWTLFTNGYTVNNNAIFGNLSQNLAGAFAWAGENLEDCEGSFAVWAPDVIYNPDYINTDGSKGAYMMYFCTSSTYIRSVIAYAVSQNAAGPYTFVDTLIYSGFTANDSYATSSTKNVNRKYTSTNIDELIAAGQVTYNEAWFNNSEYNNQLFPNAIDPTIYYDTNGTMYMCYGSWSGGIFTLEIDPKTGRCIHPKSGQTSDGRMIDSYFGTKISGGYGNSGEAPYIEYNAETGYYYLWVTYGGLTATGGYNMRVFRSKNPNGPFTDPSGNNAVLTSNSKLDNAGLKVMGNHKFSSLPTAYMAPGHNSVMRDDDGQWYLFNHTRFNNGTEYHELRVHAIYFNSEGWPVVAPYEYSGDKLSEGGYNTEDIIGSYEFINHGNDTSKNIYESRTITLNADGTISGSVTGTWSQEKGSADAVLNIGGHDYYGVFLAAQDESGTNKKVMSFTAVGSNNQTIWGVQTKAYTGSDRSPLTDHTRFDSQLVYKQDTAGGTSRSKTIGDTELLSGVSYFITNKNSRLLVEVQDGKTDDGTNIQQWEMNNGPHHEWRIVDLGNGYNKILLASDESMAMSVNGNSAENGLNIQLAPYTGADNQQWKLIKDGLYYGIVSKSSGDAAGLDVYEWSAQNGGNINQWEFWGGDCQLWKFTPVYPQVNDGIYTIKNINSSKWITEDNGNVVQGVSEELWNIKNVGDNTYSITDKNGLALTVENSSAENGSNIYTSQYIGNDSQKFKLICNKDGSYSILSMASGGKSCVDVFEISTEDGANICQWEFWGGDGQKFVIEPSSEKIPIIGDVNNDGEFSSADLVMMHKFLISDGELINWEAGDLCRDSVINIYDLVMMRKLLLNII